MKKKIIVRIANGFGNQMFLYAAAYAYSKKLGYNLLIDEQSGTEHDTEKNKNNERIGWIPKYELDIFNLSSKIADPEYKFLNTHGYIKRKYLKFIDKYHTKKKFLLEKMDKNKRTSYSDQYLFQKYYETIFFEGYFESEKYFKDYRDDLLNEFSLKSKPNLNNNIFKNIIDKSNVVSIAFRSKRYTETTKDYKDKYMQQKTEDFENSTIKYINRGVEFFKSKIDNPKFLIWSNDFENLDKCFDSDSFTFVINNNDNKILLDFSLMCQCKYFIVGSSSFHWWPAWLSTHKNKIVVCPKDKVLNVSSNIDHWPESWIKI